MNDNPLTLKRLLSNLRSISNGNIISSSDMLENNLTNRLAFQYGTLQNERDLNKINHPNLYEVGIKMNNIHPVLGEVYRDWIYNPLTNYSAPYGTFNNNVPAESEPHYSRFSVPNYEELKNWEKK